MKKWHRFAWLFLIGLMWSPGVWADQCAVELDTKAVWYNLITNADQSEVISFCEPCNDRAPKRICILDLQSGDQKAVQQLFPKAPKASRTWVDLAYFYIPTARTTYQPDSRPDKYVEVFYNLGIMTGCRPNRVSAELKFVDGVFQGTPISR
ncbi:MAG: hypothetical protein HN348_06875 [Proteobacteria bacterium]|jgi:hypothetical protein|nr:hypothetical protein [Pseudomonadota bacterium]